MLSSFAGKQVLLLQGPMGPFFWRLGKDLEAAGARVGKINFCAADALFYPRGATAYRGRPEEWREYISRVVLDRRVEAIFLFGDCRPYHETVRNVARWLKVELFVFEEGYLRPDYITLERGGVNNHSAIPRTPEAFRAGPQGTPAIPAPRPVKHAFFRAAVYATLYSVANFLFAWRYPHYRHHRPLHPLREGYAWLRSWVRKQWYLAKEAKHLRTLTTELSGRFFLAPLQVHNDAQITAHSHFATVEAFIEEVAESFARHAQPSDALVFKHHPMDRAYCDYTALMARLARRHGLEGRLYYVHDLHLPTLLRHARGTVVVNSTVGLSSLHHRTPVITLGDPVYNLPGLTFQGELKAFWHTPGSFDAKLYHRFRAWLLAHNQANGNFYRPLAEAGTHAGIFWPPLGAEVVKGSVATVPSGEPAVEPVLVPQSDAA